NRVIATCKPCGNIHSQLVSSIPGYIVYQYNDQKLSKHRYQIYNYRNTDYLIVNQSRKPYFSIIQLP
ncbi:hypothetical protein ACNO7T_17125, partial [Vibrio campbellii]